MTLIVHLVLAVVFWGVTGFFALMFGIAVLGGVWGKIENGTPRMVLGLLAGVLTAAFILYSGYASFTGHPLPAACYDPLNATCDE